MQRPGELDLYKEVIPQVGEMSLRQAGGICPHDGSEQGRGGPSSAPAPAPRGRCALASSVTEGDNVNAAPPHLPWRMGFGGSMTTSEERDRVDNVILFWYGEGERARHEKPYQTRGYIYNGVKNLSMAVVLNRIRAFPEKRNENSRTIF